MTTNRRWIISRLIRSLALLIGATFIIYATLRSAPGDMVDLALGLNGTDEMKAALRAEFGLDQSLIFGYCNWLFNAIQGDLGSSISFAPGSTVTEIAIPAFCVTIGLTSFALISALTISYIIAYFLGKPSSKQSLFLGPLACFNAAPSFVLSICFAKLINELIHYQLSSGGQIAPSWYPIPTYQSFGESFVPFLLATFAIMMGDGLFTDLLNALRSELNQLQNAQFMNAVRAKGASTTPHLIKNLIVPTLSIFTARLPLVLSAVIIVEYIFTLDGSGYLLLEAAKSRDVPVVVGVSLFFIVSVIIVNLALDLIKAQIDPREGAYSE